MLPHDAAQQQRVRRSVAQSSGGRRDLGFLALTLRALLSLLWAHRLIRAARFDEIRVALNSDVGSQARDVESTVERICDALEVACVLYPTRTRCLRRSVALAAMLRQSGADAHLNFGFRTDPYVGHAWVDIDGTPVGEDVEWLGDYIVLDRF